MLLWWLNEFANELIETSEEEVQTSRYPPQKHDPVSQGFRCARERQRQRQGNWKAHPYLEKWSYFHPPPFTPTPKQNCTTHAFLSLYGENSRSNNNCDIRAVSKVELVITSDVCSVHVKCKAGIAPLLWSTLEDQILHPTLWRSSSWNRSKHLTVFLLWSIWLWKRVLFTNVQEQFICPLAFPERVTANV